MTGTRPRLGTFSTLWLASPGFVLAVLGAGAPEARARTSPPPGLVPAIRALVVTPLGDAPAYPPGRVHSPLTPEVVKRLRELVAAHPGRDDHAFIKVGDSHTATRFTLACLARQPVGGATGTRRPGLEETRRHFASRLRTGRSAFDRRSLAARGGHHAAWALGSRRRSPLAREIAQVNPRFAIVAFGTNDMGLYRRYDRSLPHFLKALQGIVTRLLAKGVVPVVVGLPPRLDSRAARLWAARYNDATRALAAAHRVPFVDMHEALRGAPRFGLAPDGIHGTVRIGSLKACDFTPRGLRHGYNRRNLVLLEALDRVRRAALAEPRGGTAVASRR